MLANLDMNSRRVLNLPAATSNTEPVTYAQFLAAQGDLLYSGEIDGSAVVFTPAGTGSVTRNVQQELVAQAKTAFQFGAVGDGVADDTAELQAAITACIAAGGKKLVLPAGNYKVTSSLQITVGSDANNLGFTIEGEAPHQTKITYSGTGYCFVLGTGQAAGNADAWFVTIRDLAIHGSGASPTGAIKMNGCYFCRVENVGIRYFTNAGGRGIFFAGTGDIANYHNIIDHVYIRECLTGIYMDGGTGIGANSNFVRNCWFGVHATYAVHISGGDSNIIEQCEFNGSTTNAIYIEGVATGNKIMFNQFDGPTTNVNITSSATLTTLLFNTGGGSYVNASGSTYMIDATNNRLMSAQGLVIGGSLNPTGIVPLTVSAPSGLSTDAFRVNNSAGTGLLVVNNGGALDARANITTHGKLTVRNDVTNNSTLVEIDNATGTTSAANNLLTIKGHASQTANAIEIQNSSGTVLALVTPAGRIHFGATTASPGIMSGSGTPEAAVTAPVGSMYLRSNGGASTCLYIKESGTGNTGWVAK